MPPCLSAQPSHPRVRPCGAPRALRIAPTPQPRPLHRSFLLLAASPDLGQGWAAAGAIAVRGLRSEGAPSPGNAPRERRGGTLRGRAGTAGAGTRRGWFFPPVCPSPGAEWDSRSGSRCSGRLRPLPACPSFTRAAPPPFAPLRSLRAAGRPRARLCGAPQKEPPGGAAEDESEQRPGRPRRQGQPQPPPAHPHTCARLCVRGWGSPSRAR